MLQKPGTNPPKLPYRIFFVFTVIFLVIAVFSGFFTTPSRGGAATKRSEAKREAKQELRSQHTIVPMAKIEQAIGRLAKGQEVRYSDVAIEQVDSPVFRVIHLENVAQRTGLPTEAVVKAFYDREHWVVRYVPDDKPTSPSAEKR